VKLPDVGNVTVPDAYYDKFYSYAGARSAETIRRHARSWRTRPPPRRERTGARQHAVDTDYRYEAEVVPTQECKSCALEPFRRRKWNREFVWVQIPQTGNVTVPEDSYDRFYGYASCRAAELSGSMQGAGWRQPRRIQSSPPPSTLGATSIGDDNHLSASGKPGHPRLPDGPTS
jgi:hypothetical protein